MSRIAVNSLSFPKISVSGNLCIMAQSVVQNSEKKFIRIDVSSDTVCPWCFVGKKNLDNAMDMTKDQFSFEVRWHPFFLDLGAPKEGIVKSEFHKKKFGSGARQFEARMAETLRAHGYEYDTSGKIGSTVDSHRLITFAAHQGYDKQNALVEELFVDYFSRGKFIADHQVLLEAAKRVGVEGAEELPADPNKGLKEVYDELEKYSSGITGVPYYVINGKQRLSGAQPPEVFVRAFQTAAKDSP